MKIRSLSGRVKLGIAATLTVVVVLATTVVLVSRDGNGDATPRSTTTEAKVGTTTTIAVPTAPLTGLPEPDDGIRNRPVLTVKIDNHPDARPQFGIDRADVIVEERVEGGLTRFMALFQSQDADRVGPVRSLRSTDALWLRPTGGMIAYSGGIDPVRALLKPNGIVDVGADTYGTKQYKRRSDRSYEHSMYTMTPVLRELTPKDLPAPKPLFDFLSSGEKFGGAGAVPVTLVVGRAGEGASATAYDWTWDPSGGVFKRGTDGKPHEVEGVGQIAMTNVVIQFLDYRATPWRDRSNTPVDEAVVVGSGDAWFLSDGQIVRGHWSRSSPTEITKYTDASGAAIELSPGRTWLQLAPSGQFAEAR